MAVYLKKFETQSAYESAQSSLILPNVSLTVDNNTVHYNPLNPSPTPDGHLYAKSVNEDVGDLTVVLCDSLGKSVWCNLNNEPMRFMTVIYEGQTIDECSFYLADVEEGDELEPNSIGEFESIQDIGGMTILGSVATNLGYSEEYELVFDPAPTLLS